MDGSAAKAPVRQPALIRAPMVPVALAMAAGIAAGRFGPLPAAGWTVLGVLATAGAAAGLIRRACLASQGPLAADGGRSPLPAGLTVAAAIFALSAARARVAYYHLPPDHIVTYTDRRASMATIRGRIAATPAVQRPEVRMDYPREPVTLFSLDASAIRTDAGWQRASGRVQVAVQQECLDLARGQQVELVGWLWRLRGPDNPGQRDMLEVGRRTGTLVRFRVPLREGVTILPPGPASWFRRIVDRAGAWAGECLTSSAAGREGLLTEALIVGRRDPGLGRLNDAMVRAGIVHLLSISGMHLGIFLGFVYLVCRLMTWRPSRSAAAALACLAAYLVVAEPQAPLLRSAIMAAALCLATVLGRPHMSLNALALAAVVLLAIDPLQLLRPGFQLSFGIVAGIVVLGRPMRELLFGRWIRRRGLMVFRGDQRIRRWLWFTGADWLMNGLAISLTAYLTSAPLAAYHFGLFSPYATALTVLAGPLVAAVVIPGYVSLALAAAAPNASWAFGWLANRAAGLLSRLVRSLEGVPGLCLDLQPVGLLWLTACYAAIALAILHRRIRRGGILAALAAVVAAALTVHGQWPARPPGTAELDLLAVGAGQCAILRAPEGRTYLFDAGSRGRADCGQEVCIPFILRQRLPRPAAAFISHGNSDHYNALPALLGRGWLDGVYASVYLGREDNPPGAAAVEALLRQLRARGLEPKRLRAGDRLRLDGRTELEVLWPPEGRMGLAPNEASLVLLVRCDGARLLLPGDLTAGGQRELLADPGRLRADVLVMPHHGTWAETLPEFLRAVSPRIVLVSSSRAPSAPLRGGRAAREFYDGLALRYRCYSTPANGWIRVRFGRDGVAVRTMRQGAGPLDEDPADDGE